MFKSVIWLKGSRLETVPKTQRSIKEITCITKQKYQECQNGELGQPKMCETKIQLQSKSLWELIIFHCLYYYSGFIQTPAVENHSQNTPWPSQNPRENKESIWLTKKITAGCVPLCVEKCLHGSSLVMVSKMCFKGLSIFYFTGMFQVPLQYKMYQKWRKMPYKNATTTKTLLHQNICRYKYTETPSYDLLNNYDHFFTGQYKSQYVIFLFY